MLLFLGSPKNCGLVVHSFRQVSASGRSREMTIFLLYLKRSRIPLFDSAWWLLCSLCCCAASEDIVFVVWRYFYHDREAHQTVASVVFTRFPQCCEKGPVLTIFSGKLFLRTGYGLLATGYIHQILSNEWRGSAKSTPRRAREVDKVFRPYIV